MRPYFPVTVVNYCQRDFVALSLISTTPAIRSAGRFLRIVGLNFVLKNSAKSVDATPLLS